MRPVYFRCLGFASERRGWAGTLTVGKTLFETNDGQNWTQFRNGLPNGVSVSWITVQKHFHDIAISTYGRGLWILLRIYNPLRIFSVTENQIIKMQID